MRVDITDRPTGDERDDPKATLGDLLYADSSPTPVPEKVWAALIDAIAAGDQRALHTLYERAHRMVFTLIVRITNDRATAEEVTLDVFHDVWRRAASYDARGGPVIGWLMNQARSRAIDRVRFDQRKKRVDPHPDDPLPAVSSGGPDQALGARELGSRLEKALSVLRPEERQAIEMAYFGELTYEEAAARLNQPLGTVKTRIRAGLVKLRQALASQELP